MNTTNSENGAASRRVHAGRPRDIAWLLLPALPGQHERRQLPDLPGELDRQLQGPRPEHGNTNLTGIDYTFTINGSNVSAPGNCGSLPTSRRQGAAPSSAPSRGRRASGHRHGLPGRDHGNGTQAGCRPATRMAAPREGDPGTTTDRQPEGIARTGWVTTATELGVAELLGRRYRLEPRRGGDSGGPQPDGVVLPDGRQHRRTREQLRVSVTQGGTIVLPGPASSRPPRGERRPGDTFTCTFPRTFNATQSYARRERVRDQLRHCQRAATRRSPSQRATCNAGKKVVPNLVDTLIPSADGTNKTVGDAKATWPAAGFTGTVKTIPVGAPNRDMSSPRTGPRTAARTRRRRDCERRLMRRRPANRAVRAPASSWAGARRVRPRPAGLPADPLRHHRCRPLCLREQRVQPGGARGGSIRGRRAVAVQLSGDRAARNPGPVYLHGGRGVKDRAARLLDRGRDVQNPREANAVAASACARVPLEVTVANPSSAAISGSGSSRRSSVSSSAADHRRSSAGRRPMKNTRSPQPRKVIP